jgi:hypothetical protein
MASSGQRDGGRFPRDRPLAKRRVQPDVVPAVEGRVGVVVVAGQALAQVGGFVGHAGLSDAGHRQVFDHDVRRQHHGAGECAAGSAPRTAAAMEAPSLWPNSQGGDCQRSRCAARRSRAGSTSCAWRCMKSRPQASRRARRGGRSRGANRPGRGSPMRLAQLLREVASTSPANPGPRAGRRSAGPAALRCQPGVFDAHRAAGPARWSRDPGRTGRFRAMLAVAVSSSRRAA